MRTEKKARTTNSTYKKLAVQCLNQGKFKNQDGLRKPKG